MTFTISTENFFIAIILVLMAIQIYEWIVIQRLKSEILSLWKQIHVLTVNVAAEIMKLKDDKDGKEKTKE